MKTILEKLNRLSVSRSKYEVLSDCFEMWAICISNLADKPQAKAREERYREIAKKYTAGELITISEMLGEVFTTCGSMTEKGFDDYLGKLYMESGISNKNSGQFFTPYCASRLSAEIALSGNEILQQDIITINEPACGSGGMIIAAMDVLWNVHKINYTRHAFVVASDIDKCCVHMAYIQLSLAGVPAIIEHRDTLTMEYIGGRWKTPAYIFQYLRFRDVLKGTVHQ